MDLSRLEDLQNNQTVVSDHQKGFRIIAKIEFSIEKKHLSKCDSKCRSDFWGSCSSQTETSKRMFRHAPMDRCPKSSAPNRRSRTAGGKSESLRYRRAGTLVRASLSLFRRCLNFINSTRRHMRGIQHAARNKMCRHAALPN